METKKLELSRTELMELCQEHNSALRGEERRYYHINSNGDKILMVNDNETRRRQVERFPDRGIFVNGKTGAGKTTIMKSIEGIKVLKMFDFDRMIDDKFSLETKKRYEEFLYARVLLIDDMGNERSTNSKELCNLIDIRYEMFMNKTGITYYTTNLSLAELEEKYQEGTVRRIIDTCDNHTLVNSSVLM